MSGRSGPGLEVPEPTSQHLIGQAQVRNRVWNPAREANTPASRQIHEVFGVIDFDGKPVNVAIGAGFDATPATDGLTLKSIVSRDLLEGDEPCPIHARR